MGDRSAAKLTIGGTLTAAQAAGLLALLKKEAVGLDCGGWSQPSLVDEEDAERLELATVLKAAEDGHLILCKHQADGGEFADLQQGLRDLSIPYDRHSSVCPGAWECDLECFRPGQSLVNFASDENERAYVSRDSVLSAIRKIRRELGSETGFETCQRGPVARALVMLVQAASPEIEPLPPLRLEGAHEAALTPDKNIAVEDRILGAADALPSPIRATALIRDTQLCCPNCKGSTVLVYVETVQRSRRIIELVPPDPEVHGDGYSLVIDAGDLDDADPTEGEGDDPHLVCTQDGSGLSGCGEEFAIPENMEVDFR